jgi:hypothetical protein
MFILTLEWFGLPDERKRHGIQLEYGFKGKSNDELRQAWMAEVGAVHGRDRDRGAGALGRRALEHRLPFPRAFDEETKSWGEEITWDEVITRWKARGPDERGLRREAAARLPHHELPAGGVMSVEARLWSALREVEDPEIPISSSAWG